MGQASPGTEDLAAMAEFFPTRLREFWNCYFWPEWTVQEKRQFRLSYNAATTYAATQEVYFPATRLYYLALRTTTGNAPATGSPLALNKAYWAESAGEYSASDWSSTTAYVAGNAVYQPSDEYFYQCHTLNTNQAPPNATYWGRLVPFLRDIDFQQTGQNELGDVRKIWDRDAQVNEDAEAISFLVQQTGIVVRGIENVVYVEFRKPTPSFSGAEWSSATAYAVADQVYSTALGDFYKAIQAGTNHLVTDTAYWERIDFPEVLQEVVAYGIFADMLRLDGQTQKSAVQEGRMVQILRKEYDRLERQQGQTTNLNVMMR